MLPPESSNEPALCANASQDMPRWAAMSFQAEDVFELLVVARVILRQADVADVELDAFSLQNVRLDAFARRAAAEAAENFLAFFGKRKIDEQLPDVGMRRVAA